jgi:hypothetical protein
MKLIYVTSPETHARLSQAIEDKADLKISDAEYNEIVRACFEAEMLRAIKEAV